MNTYLIWLEWPEDCFRVNEKDLAELKELVPRGSEIIRAKNEKEFLENLPRATHAIVWNFDAAWFERAANLKVLATPSAGRELLPKVGPEGVVIHFGGFHGKFISESVVGAMLAWCRGIIARERTDLVWPRVELSNRCYTLAGTKAVILGYGRIGHAIGEKLEALGVAVKGIGRANFGELDAALVEADWLVMALPSDTGTDNLVGEAVLRKVPRRCVLVNIGRGNSIDDAALIAALKEGRLAGAILDVVRNEPMKEEAPLAAADIPNLVVLPHMTAFGEDYLRECFRQLANEGLLK